ncbi:9-beta-pimara-7,15-diene oxidase-like [Aegilops tauschii subsp. strangulata]|nr:9-beta-pimara-7,15-diene oxidase-like [Aegilops tauschii subsp. strangulata]
MELTAAALLFLSLVSLAILLSLLGRKSKAARPPGPWSLPFIGSLHHLLTPLPHVALRDLAKKHGPVMYLRLGQVDAVVISSPAAAQEVLRDKDINFASRPSILASQICLYGNLDVAFAPYGAYWRTMRRLCTTELLSARKVRQFALVRGGEILRLVETIRSTGRGGEPVNLGGLVMSCTNTVTAKVAFGEGCTGELQAQFLSAIEVILRSSGGLCVGDLFPSLSFVDVVSGMKRRLWRARRQLDTVLDKIIAECEARLEENKTGDDEDLLRVLLRIRDEGQLEVPMGTTNIKAVIADMFAGGTETTASTTEWVMSELIRNRGAMAKAQKEVRCAFNHKNPEDHEAHMEELCYTKMVVKEAMRLHPVVPLLLPRVCRETCDVHGHRVEEGTRVFVNAWAMARSPEYWEDAEEFRPERFEDNAADYKGTQLEYLPFGSGRRMCPGNIFALALVELVVARLLYYFDWSLPAGMRPDELDMDTVVGLTAKRSNHLLLVASPYNVPVHKEIDDCKAH